MIIGFFLCPDAFGISTIDSTAARQAAEMILQDILECGVVIDYSHGRTLFELQGCVERLSPKLSQRLLILLEEIQKKRRTIVATPPDAGTLTRSALIEVMMPDVAIVEKGGAPIPGVAESVEPITYFDSAVRRKKEQLRSPSLAPVALQRAAVQDLLGSFVKYSRTVHVIDKMIGRSAGSGRLARRFIDGLQLIVDCWLAKSVYSGSKLELVIVTAAGACGARGYVDPSDAQSVIERAVSLKAVAPTVILKDDPHGIFHARFIRAKGRCIKVDPGIDGLRDGCDCLLIDPPNGANEMLAAKILQLRDL